MANGLPPLDTDYNYAGAFTQGAAQGLTLKNALTASREQEEMKNALRQMPSGPDGAPNLDAVTNKMLQMGNVEGAAKVATIKTALSKGDIDTRLKQLDFGTKMLDLGFKTLQNSTYESYPSDYRRLASIDPVFAQMLPHPSLITDPTDFDAMKRYKLSEGMDMYKQIQLERGRMGTPFAADVNGEPGYVAYDKDAKGLVPVGAVGTPPPRWRTGTTSAGQQPPADQRPKGSTPAPGSGIKISNLQMGPNGYSITLRQPGAPATPSAGPTPETPTLAPDAATPPVAEAAPAPNALATPAPTQPQTAQAPVITPRSATHKPQPTWEQEQILKAESKKRGGVPIPEEEIPDVLNKAAADKAKALQEAKNQGGPTLSPESVDAYADYFMFKGPAALANLGRGQSAQADKAAIINRWSEKLQMLGEGANDQMVREAGVKAGQSALSQLEAQEGKIMAFARFVDKHGSVVETYSGKTDRTGSPVINRWLNAGKKAISGDKDVTAFDFAVKVLTNEYAKISSSPTGSGVMSQQEAEKFEKLLNSATTPEAVSEVIKLMRLDLENRQEGYSEQKAVINKTIGGIKPTKERTPAKAAPSTEDAYKKSLAQEFVD